MLRTFNTAVLFAVQHFPNIRSNDIWNNIKTYYIQCFLNSIVIHIVQPFDNLEKNVYRNIYE